MKQEEFKTLTAEALDMLPEVFREKLENVDIIVEDSPSADELRESGAAPGGTLLGLYRGIPLNHRGTGYGGVLPDIITLYQRPIESLCSSKTEVKTKIMEVLAHEIGHHFGMDEEDMP